MSKSRSPEQHIYLLEGDEGFLRDRRAASLATDLQPSDNLEYNRDTFQGPDIDLDDVVAACDTLPMVADRRLVVVRELDLVAASAHKRFVAYLERPNPTTALVITASATKGRSQDLSTLRKLIPHREEFGAMAPARARDHIRECARARGISITPDAISLLIDLVGSEAGRLDSEVEKAGILAGASIDVEHIEALAWRTRSHTMFELTDAIAQGDRDGMLRHVSALLADGQDPLALVGMVAWQFRNTLRGAAAAEAGSSPNEIARAGSFRGQASGRFASACSQLGTRGAARALRALQVADRRLKSSPEDRRQILERTLLELMAQA